MLRKDFVLCKTRNLLNEFMAPITAKADKPRRKFLRQAVGAILLSGIPLPIVKTKNRLF